MWIILCVDLTGLRGGQRSGEMLFLDMSMRLFPKERNTESVD